LQPRHPHTLFIQMIADDWLFHVELVIAQLPNYLVPVTRSQSSVFSGRFPEAAHTENCILITENWY
jgi:hypothetical protein